MGSEMCIRDSNGIVDGYLREYSRLGLVRGTLLYVFLDYSCDRVIIDNTARDEPGACAHLAAAYLPRGQLIKTPKYPLLHTARCSELTA